MNANHTNEGQGELFPEFRASDEGRFAHFKKEMALGRKMVISVSYENLALFFIALIMAVVIFFSLGVEKGRGMAVKSLRPALTAGLAENRPYTIQIMAVKTPEEAEREAAHLNGAGYKAFVARSNEWYHICAGRYADTTEINKDLAAIRQKYPNCYVRKLKERIRK